MCHCHSNGILCAAVTLRIFVYVGREREMIEREGRKDETSSFLFFFFFKERTRPDSLNDIQLIRRIIPVAKIKMTDLPSPEKLSSKKKRKHSMR